jgi:hypothetical protein
MKLASDLAPPLPPGANPGHGKIIFLNFKKIPAEKAGEMLFLCPLAEVDLSFS